VVEGNVLELLSCKEVPVSLYPSFYIIYFMACSASAYLLSFWFVVYVGMHWKLQNIFFYVVRRFRIFGIGQIMLYWMACNRWYCYIWQLLRGLELAYCYMMLCFSAFFGLYGDP